MNRVLNVFIVLGLASTLACAPGSRHQSGAIANNNKAKAGPTPAPTAGPQDLTPQKAAQPIPVNKSFDPAAKPTLTNANAFPDISSLTITILFSTKDSKNQRQDGKIVVDQDSNIATDATLTSANYVCNDTDRTKTPGNCSDGIIKFTWNKLDGQAEIKTNNGPDGKGLNVTEAVDSTQAPKQFGVAHVLNLNITLGDSATAFNRTNVVMISAETADAISKVLATAKAANTPVNPKDLPAYDDKQAGTGADANTTIYVIGLPKVALDGSTPVVSAEPPSKTDKDAPRVSQANPITKTTGTDKQFIYTLGIQNQNDAKDVHTLTLTTSSPLTEEEKAAAANSDADKAAASSDTDKSAAGTTTGTAAAPAPKPADKAAADAAAAGNSSTGTAATGTGPHGNQGAPDTLSAGNGGTAGTDASGKTPTDKSKKSKGDKSGGQQAGQQSSGQPTQTAQVPTTTGTGAPQKCDFGAHVEGSYIKATVDFAADGKASIEPITSGGWRITSCDSSTGRLVDQMGSGVVACASRWIPVQAGVESHTETMTFKQNGDGTCSGLMVHYNEGSYDLGGKGTGCFVRPIDGLSLRVSNAAEGDGFMAHSAPASNISVATSSKMYPTNNPGQYQTHSDDWKVYWEIFAQPWAATDKLKCWGRTTSSFNQKD